MPDDKDVLTPAQFAAARMLIARLGAEAAEEEFSEELLGIHWLANKDMVCAETEEGEFLLAGDFLYAAIVLLWSMVVGSAEANGQDTADIVSRLALGLASHEPAA